VNKILSFLQDFFAPSSIKCLCCGKDIFTDLGFCDDCLKEVVMNDGKTCKRCGVGLDGEEDYCGNCAFDKIYFDRAYSSFSYEGAVRKAILDMKFFGAGLNSKVLARYLVYTAMQNDLKFDLVTYAPMSKKSQKLRHYNQAKLLAQAFCDILDKENCLVEAIVKVKETERQESLGRQERKINLIGSYKVGADVKGKRVLVIDDIKTTGATLNECAKVLKRAGATSVVGLTVASRKESVQYELED